MAVMPLGKTSERSSHLELGFAFSSTCETLRGAESASMFVNLRSLAKETSPVVQLSKSSDR